MNLINLIIAWTLLTITPGPDIIFVINESIKNGAKNGLLITLGLASGLIVHSILVIGGVAIIINNSPTLFNTIKYLGVAYLMYIGISGVIKSLKKENCKPVKKKADNNTQIKPDYNPYTRGVIMNISNPKVLLFFLSFLPQYMGGENSSFLKSLMIIGIIFGITVIIFGSCAILTAKISQYFKATVKMDGNIQKFAAFFELAIYSAISVYLIIH